MISHGANRMSAIYKGSIAISRVYKGSTIVYESSLLPYAYQQVQYIESNGLNGMSTGFIPTSRNVKVEIKLYVTGAPSSEMDILATSYSPDGGKTSMTGDAIVLGQVASSIFLYSNGDSNVRYLNNDMFMLQADNLIQLDFNATTNEKTLTVNGTSVVGVYTTNIVEKGYPVYIMGANGYRPMIKGNRLYYTKLWQDDILVRDLIPCYQKSDNKPGMYDLVHGVFYSNNGSGDYIAGPIVS